MHPRTLTYILFATLVVTSACQRRPAGSRVPPPNDVYDMRAIDIANFESDANLRRRILFMPYGEAAQRLGALRFEAVSKFSFSQGGQDLDQEDTFKITQDANGALHVVSQTPASQMEMILLGENVFIRYQKGVLRQKSRRDVDTDELTSIAWSSLQEVLALFPQATFSDARKESVGGRSATRFRLALGKGAVSNQAPVAVHPLPLPLLPHARWRDLSKPLDLTGSVSVDNATGVVVKAEVDGHIEVNDRPVRPTELTVHYKSSLDAGHSTTIKTPRGIAEYHRPMRPRDPLSFFRDHLAPIQDANKEVTKED